jgi:hypothetical protein
MAGLFLDISKSLASSFLLSLYSLPLLFLYLSSLSNLYSLILGACGPPLAAAAAERVDCQAREQLAVGRRCESRLC